VLAAGGNSRAAVPHRCDHVDVVAEGEQQLERLAEDGIVLHEEDPNGRRHWT
jgi:hypothetical protein